MTNPFSSPVKAGNRYDLRNTWKRAEGLVARANRLDNFYGSASSTSPLRNLPNIVDLMEGRARSVHSTLSDTTRTWGSRMNKANSAFPDVHFATYFPRESQHSYPILVTSADGRRAAVNDDWRIVTRSVDTDIVVTVSLDGTVQLNEYAQTIRRLSTAIRQHTTPEFYGTLEGDFVYILTRDAVPVEDVDAALSGMRGLPYGLIETIYGEPWVKPFLAAHASLSEHGRGAVRAEE